MLTNLGLQQNFQVGSDYRDLYISSDSPKQILGISEGKYAPSQVSASAPDEPVLLNTATAFLQGLYPPLDSFYRSIASQTLNNGTEYTNPLHGYQYIVLHGEEEESPDTIWIKGDDECPALTKAVDTFPGSTVYQERLESTRSFYHGFWPILKNVYDLTEDDMSYDNAFTIFDLINVGSIHNTSMKDAVTSDQLFQLRTLADSYEFDANYNASQPDRSIGAKTVNHAILSHLNETVTSKGGVKFSVLAGSYDTMLAFFGLNQLTAASPNFYGLPGYASTMAFEILTEDDVSEFPSDTDSLMVRFLFRNGSDAGAPLTPFPMFGGSEMTLSWSDFKAEMQSRSISTVAGWCDTCRSTQNFCLTATGGDITSAKGVTETQSKHGMSKAVAGVIGALVTLGIVCIVAAVAFILRKRTCAVPVVTGPSAVEKGSASSSIRD
ncbi:hypothetical protein N7481_001521 [Penicillium waksmanii]|uniref:uncharacterized protein n=1 Tax=Penicillium waksmanii TaxID=69791 RepID=UPI0025473908|nr:uncharacterized protein N7481_001521 [Penicillium waksmanii]KAJ6001112.1 hypothetical protein N7481_001521 [Penicillium waksmanii]